MPRGTATVHYSSRVRSIPSVKNLSNASLPRLGFAPRVLRRNFIGFHSAPPRANPATPHLLCTTLRCLRASPSLDAFSPPRRPRAPSAKSPRPRPDPAPPPPNPRADPAPPPRRVRCRHRVRRRHRVDHRGSPPPPSRGPPRSAAAAIAWTTKVRRCHHRVDHRRQSAAAIASVASEASDESVVSALLTGLVLTSDASSTMR